MAFPSYQIYHLNIATGDVVSVLPIEQMESIQYSKILNGIGQIVISIPDIDGNLFQTIDWDDMIEIRRQHEGAMIKEGTYLVRSKNPFIDSSGIRRLVFGGLSLEHLLQRRVVNPDDDPLMAGGFSTKAGAADTVIREYIQEQIGVLASEPRQISKLTVPVVPGTFPPVGMRLRFENLLESVQNIAKGRVDFEVEHIGNGNFQVNIQTIGQDKTRTTNYPSNPWIGFNVDRGNLKDVSLALNRNDELNYVYLLGEGGSNRTILEAQGVGTADSIYNRIEYSLDTRRGTNATEYLTAAAVSLSESKMVTEFDFNVDIGVTGGRYRTDWVLGDKVTAYWDDFMQDLRVAGIEFDLSESGENITITIDNKDQ